MYRPNHHPCIGQPVHMFSLHVNYMISMASTTCPPVTNRIRKALNFLVNFQKSSSGYF